MDVSQFNFDLPEERIALRPASPRDSARMMVIHRDGRLEHRKVCDLPEYLGKQDALVVNDTRVIPARLRGLRVREEGPAKIELLLHHRLGMNRFSVLARPARKLQVGDKLTFDGLTATVLTRGEGGEADVEFDLSGAALDSAIALHGEMPLPPYIVGKRKADARDKEDYQTIFARDPGSAAAPTAGLHFTPDLLVALDEKGVIRKAVTLRVGLGTFLPVTASDTEQHQMYAEHAYLDLKTAGWLNAVRETGGRIVAVGTTSLRVLESAADSSGLLSGFDSDTRIFITPGYQFRAVDMLMTNFHLPRSTLFMLVCSFSGMEIMKNAYAEAIRLDYRFYSYGDACLLIGKS
ncbi:MAG: tRNA preQ1(34) S-adenosylmethionine ribosyltransferase-isomerase QueA [Pseudomonadota bacterium]